MNKPRIHQPATARRWMTVISLSFIIFHLSFSRVAAQTTVEYWFDHDPGLGLATQTVAPTDAAGNVQFEVPTDALNVGNHLMGVRTVGTDAEGKPFYGPTLTQQVGIQRAAYDGSISRLEYFWDEDPGAGKGLPIAFTPGEVVTLQDAELSTEGLQPGRHVLHVRAFSGFGWGPTISQEVMVTGGALVVDFVEYFWDSDPGMGKATPLPVVAGKELNLENIEFSTADLTPGLHNLGIRSRSRQSWGATYETYSYAASSWQQTMAQDADVLLMPADGTVLNHSLLPAQMHFTLGDANLTGLVDVNDVQRTLNYVVNQNNTSTFGLWAANTFTEEESETLINIQDIVCTVNIVLDNEGSATARPQFFPVAPEVSEVSVAPQPPPTSSTPTVGS